MRSLAVLPQFFFIAGAPYRHPPAASSAPCPAARRAHRAPTARRGRFDPAAAFLSRGAFPNASGAFARPASVGWATSSRAAVAMMDASKGLAHFSPKRVVE